MFKRIVNQLLGNTSGSMKTHTIDDVRTALYYLIAQYQTTTTLDVKNELRRQGFQAFQDQVSQMVSAIASQDNLSSRNNGKFNMYGYGTDTKEAKQVYLERQDEFWEGVLKEKSIFIYNGKIGTDGNPEQIGCYKNAIADRELNRLVREKIQAGFTHTTDPRPPLLIRKQYGHLFGKVPAICRIGYYNVTKKEYADNQLITKTAGYTFSWNVSSSKQALQSVLSHPAWSSATVTYDQAELLGEKIVGQVSDTDTQNGIHLEADNKNIFQVELTFEDGHKAILSKFQLDLQKDLLPLVKQFVG